VSTLSPSQGRRLNALWRATSLPRGFVQQILSGRNRGLPVGVLRASARLHPDRILFVGQTPASMQPTLRITQPTSFALASLVILASCGAVPAVVRESEATFEQQVVALDRGMTVDQVVEVLGPPHSQERSEDGSYDVWVWSRRSIRARVHDPSRSCSTFLTAKVSFRAGVLVFVELEYRLV